MKKATDTQLLPRTKRFALRVIRLVQALEQNQTSRTLGHQLLRSGMSVGANYRAATRARSKPDFINKLKISEEECDESLYWMELLADSQLVTKQKLEPLMDEGSQILAMLVSSIQTTRKQAQAKQLVTLNSTSVT
jgi:four helix bundle protein